MEGRLRKPEPYNKINLDQKETPGQTDRPLQGHSLSRELDIDEYVQNSHRLENDLVSPPCCLYLLLGSCPSFQERCGWACRYVDEMCLQYVEKGKGG